jgi:hypothetical protein
MFGYEMEVFRQSDGWRYVRVAEFRGSRPVRQDKDASEKFATKLLKTRQFYIAFVTQRNFHYYQEALSICISRVVI